MGQLLAFLFKFRAFFTFLVLEVLCIWLIISNNNYQKTVFINTASGVVGSITESSDEISDYFELNKVNKELAAENERLRALLLNQKVSPDTLIRLEIDSDTTDSIQYFPRYAEVIDNSVAGSRNIFIINRGSDDGITPNMGVINSLGVVGKIRSVSSKYATAISVLNTSNAISARHKTSNRIGTVQWDGVDPQKAKLLYITRDVVLQVGDTVITSGFNAIFPKAMTIGFVSAIEPDPNQQYWDIDVDLSVDFGALEYVYVIENRFKVEKDSLVQSDPLNQQ
ncbi:MAG: rod shape-determining protein MreC [Roseivirga sp.]|nr:rod shape-determining protein MreC [Roseivirga sp.]